MKIKKIIIYFASLFILNKAKRKSFIYSHLELKNKMKAFIFDSYQDMLYSRNKDTVFDAEKIKNDLYLNLKDKFDNPLLSNAKYFVKNNCSYVWGLLKKDCKLNNILEINNKDAKFLFLEDGFLRSATTYANDRVDMKYRVGISFIMDDLTCYYDATRISRMEQVLNSDFEISEEQKERARKNINRILETKITKYNHQPIYKPNIGKNKQKILVVDQSYGDLSIEKGLANDKTFEAMIKTAIKDNPNCDIIIKTHPDAKYKKKISYFSNIQEGNGIYKITESINPLSLIEYVDKVYVCSTQLGFEALMAGKEVHTFGVPFYSNWGLTVDHNICSRRQRKRTLEEIFYIAYIMFSLYINPVSKEKMEIEEAIEYLIGLREEYFIEFNIRSE